ncbi:MAG TPA: formyltransferase family protein [Gaiellaceae bacterium]|nr:formyltransferase family protein [Gaiellaceae bacterium]
MRVVLLTQIVPVVEGYSEVADALGHEVPAVIVGRPFHQPAEAFIAAAGSADVVFAASKHSIAALLRAYDADVGLCTGFPWLITQEAIDTPPKGIVNGHPTLLPKGRGPHPWAWAIRAGETEIGLTYHFMDATFDTGNILAQKAIPIGPDDTEETLIPHFQAVAGELLQEVFAKLEAGDPGVPQGEGEYQQMFEPEYAVVDLSQPAAEVHRQVRAWSFMPERSRSGPVLDGRRLVRTSVTEVDGAEQIDCGDGPLWILEAVPV